MVPPPRHAIRQTGCLPWDYLNPLARPLSICLRNHVHYFKSNVTSKSVRDSECGYCAKTCNEQLYTHKTDTKTIDPSVVCSDEDTRCKIDDNGVMWYNTLIVPQTRQLLSHSIETVTDRFAWIYRRTNNWVAKANQGVVKPSDDLSHCLLKAAKDISFVVVEKGSSTFLSAEYATRYTRAELLSNFGKITCLIARRPIQICFNHLSLR